MGTVTRGVARASSRRLSQAVTISSDQPSGWQQYLSGQYWLDKVGGTDGLVLLGCWFVLGLVSGYLVKRYSRLVLLVIAAVFTVGACAEYAGVISIHWEVVRGLLGDHAAGQSVYSVPYLIGVVRENSGVVAVSLMGFIIGHSMR